MPLAYVITCYRNPGQVARLAARLEHPDDFILVHVDKKVDAAPFAKALEAAGVRGVRFVQPRVACYWGGWGVVEATLRAARMALDAEQPFTHLVALTGQDYPVKPMSEIRAFLGAHSDNSFMSWSAGEGRAIDDEERVGNERWLWEGDLYRLDRRHYRVGSRTISFPNRKFPFPRRRSLPHGLEPHMGCAYWCLNRDIVTWLLEFIEKRSDIPRFFKRTLIPDEAFFHTVLLASPLADSIVNDDLRYMVWQGPHPKIIDNEDVPAAVTSSKLFARKFDMQLAPSALDLLDALQG